RARNGAHARDGPPLRDQTARRVRPGHEPLGDGGAPRGREPPAAGVPGLARRAVARDAKRVLQREPAEIKRAADDHAAQPAMTELRERGDVLERAHATGIDDVAAERARDRLRRREVKAL